jgi:hypothetical protein
MTHTVESLMALVERIISEAHQTGGAEGGSLYADITGPRNEERECSKFRSDLREALRDEYHRGIDAATEKCRGRRAAAGLVVNEILALKEQP